MRILKIIFLIFTITGLLSCNQNKKPPQAKNGILDLRNWDFEHDGKIPPSGTWEFYYGKFLTKEDFDTAKHKQYIDQFREWNAYSYGGHEFPFTGYASYHLKIILKNKSRYLMMNLAIPPRSSFKFFVNNELIGHAGILGTTRKTCQPEYNNQVYCLPNNCDTLDMVFWVANFHYWVGGLFGIGNIGKSDEIMAEKQIYLIRDSFVVGTFLIFFFNFLFVYIFRRKEVAYLYFCIWSLILAFRVAATGELIILKIIPGLDWELLIKFEISMLYLLGVFGTLYWDLFLNLKTKKIVSKIFIYYGIINILIIIFTPAVIYTQLLNFGKVYVILIILYYLLSEVYLVIKKKETQLYLFIGLNIMFLGSINEILSFLGYGFLNLQIFNSTNGFFILLLILGIYMSRQYSVAYKNVENLSLELTKHKEELEIKVEERTKELKEEKEKSDNLLLNVLPEPIANRLKDGETQIADHFDEASIIFIDIAEFTKISSKSSPQIIVNELNKIFTIFDKISQKYGIEKIKTIGDCYMAAAGIPEPRQDHAEAVASMAMEVMEVMKGYKTEEGFDIRFRIGLDCGPIVAGVIGEQKFIYDLWGDPVNTASRMEYFGVIGKVQCTTRFKDKLEISHKSKVVSRKSEEDGSHQSSVVSRQDEENNSDFQFIERGEIEVKGKGVMRTWFLEAKKTSMLEEA